MTQTRGQGRWLPELFIAIVLVLVAYGALITYTTSVYYAQDVFGSRLYFFNRALLWVGLGTLAALVASCVHYQLLQKLSALLFLAVIILLILVLVPGIGRSVNNATRWLSVAGFTLQPSELAKYVLIIFVAKWLSVHRRHMHRFWRNTAVLLLLVAVPLLLILKEPDLGTPVVIGVTVLIMLFVGGVPLRHLLLVGACSIPPLVALVWLYPYRLRRLIVFLNPDADPLNTGFQIRQSLIAIGSGNINGLGLGMSVQKMHYLPEAHTDFAFAIIGEELGFVGAATTVLLFLLFFYTVYRLAMQIQDLFGHLVAVGIMSILALQTVINIGVVTGCLPTKGLALPFISYGGSSLVMTLAACGLLLSIVHNQRYLRVDTGVARGYDETIV